jgi:FemAB-related protein (PEP-CTERM system-associated)
MICTPAEKQPRPAAALNPTLRPCAPPCVRQLNPETEAGWQEFVTRCSVATVFHELAWKRAVEEAYGHRAHYLFAERQGAISGVLPLFYVHGPLTGRALVSLPYAVYGGIAATDSASMEALYGAAIELSEQWGARYVELRQRHACPVPGVAVDRYVTFRKTLPRDPGQVLGQLPGKARNVVRKAQKAYGLTASPRGADGVDQLYPIYNRALRRLGSPPYRKRFLRALATHYGDRALVLIIEYEGRPIAGQLALRFRDEMVSYIGASDERCSAMSPNNFMYLSLMETASREGLGVFDFGRTRKNNRGGMAFKKNQGATPEDLPYLFSVRRGSVPNLTPGNRSFDLPRRAWRRLPLLMTRAIGACVTRWIP